MKVNKPAAPTPFHPENNQAGPTPNLFHRIFEHRVFKMGLEENIKVIFSATAIIYNSSKIFLLDTLLVRNIYKIIKLLKKIFSFIRPDGSRISSARSLLYDPKARYTLLKLITNCFTVLSEAYNLITKNEITKLAYEAVGLGANFNPLSERVMWWAETILMPLNLLKLVTKTAHLYLAIKKVWVLDSSVATHTKRAAWLILGKASLDFGKEALRAGLSLAGISTGACYPLIFTLAFLDIVSNSLGLVMQFTSVKVDGDIVVAQRPDVE